MLDYRPVRTTFPPTAAAPALGWVLAALPPVVAVVAWPLLFAIFFVMSFTISLMVMTACLFWAWNVSERLSAWRYWTRVAAMTSGRCAGPTPGYRMRLKALLFSGQALIILLSCPLFDLALHFAGSHGIRIGWWPLPRA